MNEQQNPDGSWSPATPLPYLGWKARLEQWARRHNMPKLARMMATWDEAGLGT